MLYLVGGEESMESNLTDFEDYSTVASLQNVDLKSVTNSGTAVVRPARYSRYFHGLSMHNSVIFDQRTFASIINSWWRECVV